MGSQVELCDYALRILANPWAEHTIWPPYGNGVVPGSECGACRWCKKYRRSVYYAQRRDLYRRELLVQQRWAEEG